MESLCHGIDFISTNYPFQLSSTGRALTIVHAVTTDLHSNICNHSIDINSDYTKDNGVSVDDGDDTTASEVIGIKRALSNDERYAVKRTKIEADKTKLLVMKSGSYRYRLM